MPHIMFTWSFGPKPQTRQPPCLWERRRRSGRACEVAEDDGSRESRVEAAHTSIDMCAYLSIDVSMYVSIYLSIYLSICLSV